MSKPSRIIVLVTALASLFAVMSSTAGAVTWTNTGSTTIHATGVGFTISVGSNNYTCTGSTLTATAPAHSAISVYSATGTLTYAPCTLAGQSTYFHCGFTLTGATFSEPSQTTGVMDMTCVQRLTSTNTALCHLEGSAPVLYTNPTSATNTPGRFTLPTNGSGLTVTHAIGTSCLLGTGAGHLSEQTMTVTSVAGSPILTRQA